MAPHAPILLLLLILLTQRPTLAQPPPTFVDVTATSGIIQTPANKFGGPCVADIDSDGIYDLLLSYHASAPMRIFYGTASGVFTPSNFSLQTDIHGVAVGQRTARSRNRLVSVSVGGRRGRDPRPPFIYEVTPERSLREVTNLLGFGEGKGRGRVTLFMDLGMRSREQMAMNHGGPDVLFVNFLGNDPSLRDFAYENQRGLYTLRRVPGQENDREERGELIDIDGDGRMELVIFREFRIYKLIAPFTFELATDQFIPGGIEALPGRTTASAVEFDYDNDGDFDLYVARTDNRLITTQTQPIDDDFSDVLFQNRNGVLVDVTEEAGIPRGTLSMGVTAGDFNNDGYIDLMLAIWNAPDLLLLNRGDGTFETVSGLLPRLATDRGDHAVAVDYDLDGSVDLIVGRGATEGFNGLFQIFKNSLTAGANKHYLLVRVLNDPPRSATSLHAVVTVVVNGSQRLVRRVGSAGAQAGGPSYIDTVHFGLGNADVVRRVIVRWTSGVWRSMENVTADQKIVFGVQ